MPQEHKEQISRYHPLLVTLHWLLAALIVAALALGALVMAGIPNSDPMKLEALRSHMIGGGLIMMLMPSRYAVRALTARPPEADAGNLFFNKLAWFSHRALYVLVLAQAGSGVVMALQTHLPEIVFMHQGTLPADFWGFPIRYVHYVVSRMLMTVIALHVTGALYHVFVRGDGLMKRMWFGRPVISASDQISPSNRSSSMVRS